MSLHDFRRVAGLVLAACILTSFLSGCKRGAFSTKTVDVPEMARLVVDSMQDISESEEFYKLIPESQREGVSYSQFYEYISILQKMMPSGSRIDSFEIVQGEERDQLISQMAKMDGSLLEKLLKTCVPVKVNTTAQRVSGTPVYVYLQTRSDGVVYLSQEWIQSCIDLYAFSVHYFEAYTSGNVTDVTKLLAYTDMEGTLLQSEAVLKEKAKEMIRFYSVNVKSAVAEYELVSIDASDLIYLQPEVLDIQLQAKSRQVHFASDDNNVISVEDTITSELKTADLYLYYDGHRAIRIGDSATASQVNALFGEPLSVSCGPEIVRETNDDGTISSYRNILVRYTGFAITVYGTFVDSEEWEGNYVRFRVWGNDDVSIGTSMNVTKNTWDLLQRYPFADATDYVLHIHFDGEDYELSFTIGDKANGEEGLPITEMRLTWLRSDS